ncbi:glycoside hydrolase family 127 protein [Dyella telluris]|uniref:Glycoside hydrolase family 127 protein n=1 Tax=Dyella telluris TaxID=2763498 RepID=A0A7G8Q1J0_9GAMM|nr:glycoside hydrolase family 127 protein [Dyella telluris]QNK00648.1 glycoside hydrolase family 127 protein [Dyella telluris]
MPERVDHRRRFLKRAATTLASLAVLPKAMALAPDVADTSTSATPAAGPGVPDQSVRRMQSFGLGQVRLLDSDFSRAAAINQRYLHTLPVDRLAHSFRVQAGIASTAKPFGGWEKPDCELRGHFTGGHYLSAVALTFATTGDVELKQRGDQLVSALAACQRPNGYLSAFPESFFDRLSSGQKVWAPFYTIHKILVGMLDMYQHTGNAQALQVAVGIGNWSVRWLNGFSDVEMAHILKTEYGGMNDALYELYAITGNGRYLDAAHRFDQVSLFDPLSAHRDELQGLHSNTQVPKVIGAARRYELTGEPRYRRIAEFFWETVTHNRTYATGGSSNDEFWNTPPGDLKGQLGLYSAECCVAYNLLKLTRKVYAWNGDPRAFDYYERTLYNARLGTQDADGMKLYYYPLQPGAAKFYNSPTDSFWCCTGSGAEEFARFNDSIYFRDDDDLYVNLFIPSELDWPERKLRLRQETAFPREPVTRLRLGLASPATFALNLRVPAWIGSGARVRLNGQTLDVFASPGSYLTLRREWHDGDRVEMDLPMRLTTESLPGDDNLQATLYGPLVLAARLGDKGLTHDMQYCGYDAAPKPEPKPWPAPRVTAGRAGEAPWMNTLSAQDLRFEAHTRDGRLAVAPLNQVYGERYAVYWQSEPGATGNS